MRGGLLAGLLVIGCASGGGPAGDPAATAGAPPDSTAESPAVSYRNIVTVGALPAITMAPGDSAVAVVPVTIREGFHVQANPASDPFLIPLQVMLEVEDGFELAGVDYPPGRPFRLQGAEEEILTCEGEIPIGLRIVASADAAPGTRLLRGRVRYQACDTRRCLFPADVAFELSVVLRP